MISNNVLPDSKRHADPLQFNFDPSNRTLMLRNGYLIGKFCNNPLRNSFTILEEIFKGLIGFGRLNSDDEIQSENGISQYLELKEYIDSKRKLVDCLKWSRRDPFE